MKSFASDNYSSVSPEILEYLTKINSGHAEAYGFDIYTKKAQSIIKKTFSQNAQVYFVFSGTAANILSIKTALKSYQSIIGPATSHFNTKEAGAPEANTGSKFIPVKEVSGKIDFDDLEEVFKREKNNFPHSPKPKMLTIAQATEYGTVYSQKELATLSLWCKKNGLYFHIDASRIYNAAIALNCNLSEIVSSSNADIISIGGTKNGLMFAEAVLVFNDKLTEDFVHLQKQSLQLYSKMRYLSAQYIPFFENGLWKRNAQKANDMTKKLMLMLKSIPEIKFSYQIETNHIFAEVPKKIIKPLQKYYPFYVWDQGISQIRLVTSFDTTEDDINNFIYKLKSLIN